MKQRYSDTTPFIALLTREPAPEIFIGTAWHYLTMRDDGRPEPDGIEAFGRKAVLRSSGLWGWEERALAIDALARVQLIYPIQVVIVRGDDLSLYQQMAYVLQEIYPRPARHRELTEQIQKNFIIGSGDATKKVMATTKEQDIVAKALQVKEPIVAEKVEVDIVVEAPTSAEAEPWMRSGIDDWYESVQPAEEL